MIEDAGWKYIQVTKLDIGDEAGEEALARRVAERIQEVTGKTVQLTMRQTTQQISDVRKLRRIPLYKRLKFEPLLPIIPTTQNNKCPVESVRTVRTALRYSKPISRG